MSAQLFGKLPAHGDFVARGLSATQRDAIDAWLAASMACARDALGDAFAERFDRALPWRAEGQGVTGAIAASQDAVGRRFPLMLLAAGDDAVACEALLYVAIGERWTADRLAAAAGAAPPTPPVRWYGDGDAREGACPTDLVAAMLA